jgi:hypothetical protein
MKLLTCLMTLALPAFAVETVYMPLTEPQALRAGAPVTVRASVRVAAHASRDELHWVVGGRLNYLGALNDDGKGADRYAGDLVFSGYVTLGLERPGVQTLRATAYVGQRALPSLDGSLESFPAGVPLETKTGEPRAVVLDSADGGEIACDEITV